MYPFDHPAVDRLIRLALEEDVGRGDATTRATIPINQAAHGKITAKADVVLAGLPLIAMVLAQTDKTAEVRLLVQEGRQVPVGTVVAEGARTGRRAAYCGADFAQFSATPLRGGDPDSKIC